MPSRVLSVLLVLALTGSILSPYVAAAGEDRLTFKALKRIHPEARFVRVTPRALHAVTQRTPGRMLIATDRWVQLAQAEQTTVQPLVSNTTGATNAAPGTVARLVQAHAASNNVIEAVSNRVDSVESLPPAMEPEVRDRPAAYHGHVHGDFLFDLTELNWGSDDLGIVLYVLIGGVVVAAFLVYTVDYVYQLIAYPDTTAYWCSLDLQSAWVAGRGENGFFLGPKLSTGYIARDAHAGLSLEAGYFDIDVEVEGPVSNIRANGAYGLVGPHIHWLSDPRSRNPSQVALELLVGTTDGDIDLLSVARMNVSLGWGSRTRLGLTIGAVYADVDLDEGFVRDHNNFSLLIGGQVGFRL